MPLHLLILFRFYIKMIIARSLDRALLSIYFKTGSVSSFLAATPTQDLPTFLQSVGNDLYSILDLYAIPFIYNLAQSVIEKSGDTNHIVDITRIVVNILVNMQQDNHPDLVLPENFDDIRATLDGSNFFTRLIGTNDGNTLVK